MIRLGIAFLISVVSILAGCSVTPSATSDRMTIISRDWLNQSRRDIQATLEVRRIDPRVYSFSYSFAIPLDPVNGLSPSEFHFYTFCVASSLTKSAQRSHWVLGTFDKNTKYQNTKSLEVFIATLNPGEAPPSISKDGKPIYWIGSPSAADGLYESCSRLLQPQHMWAAPAKK